MVRKLFILLAVLAIGINAHGQLGSRSEIGIMLGGSNYVGDINNAREVSNQTFKNQFETSFDFYNTSFMAGLIYRYNFSPRWVLKGSLIFTKLWGEDAHFDNSRNLSFSTWCNEASLVVEFNFLDYLTGSRMHRISPYMFAGLALFYMNPQTDIFNPYTHETETINLRDFATEGQGIGSNPSIYSQFQLAIPFGLGVKFSISDYICIGLEYGWRKTFTDYIDDISTIYADRNELASEYGNMSALASDRTNEIEQGVYHKVGAMRGNDQTKDWYNFFGITFTTKLPSSQKCETYNSVR
ncbi:MAG: DUF6089 family protein [Bacteroidales bacterium]|jgi:opacity protein-like surface antigen|nr:DUF6089 family protein [Bacteroidales bacterium]